MSAALRPLPGPGRPQPLLDKLLETVRPEFQTELIGIDVDDAPVGDPVVADRQLHDVPDGLGLLGLAFGVDGLALVVLTAIGATPGAAASSSSRTAATGRATSSS